MAVPLSPSIRERACPARLRPARTATCSRRTEECMDIYCGIDWSEDHHDIALAGRDGQLLARCRISDDAAGLTALLDLLAEHGDTPDDLVPVAIETPRGLLVACLRATGRRVTRSTRWPWPGTGTGTRSPGRNPITATRSSWPTCCAPTCARTGRCPPTPNWPRPSRCWPAPSRTPSGTAPPRTTSSAPTCASTSPASWPPSPRSRAASCAPRPAPSWPPRRPPPTPPGSPWPSCAPR